METTFDVFVMNHAVIHCNYSGMRVSLTSPLG